MNEDIYMTDSNAHNLRGFIRAIEILARHTKDGLMSHYMFSAEHDIIYAHIDEEQLPEQSEDGQELSRLGWHMDDYGWAYFT